MKSPAGLAPHFLAATLFLAVAVLRAADAAGSLNPQALRARMLELFDGNNDGRLDETERAKATKYAEELGFLPAGPLRAQAMQRFDTNGNGKIDDAERAAVREFLRQRFPGAGLTNMTPAEAPPAAPPAPEKADPAKLALERLIRLAVATNADQLKRFDRDGDGKISNEEWAMARSEIREVLGDGLVLQAMMAEEEDKRMAAALAEVARRREMADVVARVPEEEAKRLLAVAAEVERRRKLRLEAEAAMGTPRPPTPPVTRNREEQEAEAKVLVKDLLEIGMAQRRAYELAKAKQEAEVAAKNSSEPALAPVPKP
jgi:hypothetical protein